MGLQLKIIDSNSVYHFSVSVYTEQQFQNLLTTQAERKSTGWNATRRRWRCVFSGCKWCLTSLCYLIVFASWPSLCWRESIGYPCTQGILWRSTLRQIHSCIYRLQYWVCSIPKQTPVQKHSSILIIYYVLNYLRLWRVIWC